MVLIVCAREGDAKQLIAQISPSNKKSWAGDCRLAVADFISGADILLVTWSSLIVMVGYRELQFITNTLKTF
nr:hypothetical protein [uncultured Cohaesibacter sp.]